MSFEQHMNDRLFRFYMMRGKKPIPAGLYNKNCSPTNTSPEGLKLVASSSWVDGLRDDPFNERERLLMTRSMGPKTPTVRVLKAQKRLAYLPLHEEDF